MIHGQKNIKKELQCFVILAPGVPSLMAQPVNRCVC